MVEADRPHAARLVAPEIRVLDHRTLIGEIHLGIEVEMVTGRREKALAPADAGLLTRRDVLDLDALLGNPRR